MFSGAGPNAAFDLRPRFRRFDPIAQVGQTIRLESLQFRNAFRRAFNTQDVA